MKFVGKIRLKYCLKNKICCIMGFENTGNPRGSKKDASKKSQKTKEFEALRAECVLRYVCAYKALRGSLPFNEKRHKEKED